MIELLIEELFQPASKEEQDARKPFNKGDRIEMIEMYDDFDPILPGSQGTVTEVDYQYAWDQWHLYVVWDSGRCLTVIYPKDKIKKI